MKIGFALRLFVLSCIMEESFMKNSALVVIDLQNDITKNGYTVHVLSDCITSYDKKKLPEMLSYYESKGCEVLTLRKVVQV